MVNGLRKGQNPRLQFTDAEREDSRLKEHIRHADKAADKAEAARAKMLSGIFLLPVMMQSRQIKISVGKKQF